MVWPAQATLPPWARKTPKIRLTETWKAGQRIFAARDSSGVDYVYLWATSRVGFGTKRPMCYRHHKTLGAIVKTCG
jgi:hypothetical protein